MVASLGRRRAIGARRNTGEVSEIMNQVSLIRIAILGRDRAPINMSATLNETDDLLHASHAEKPLGAETDLITKMPQQRFR